jgi:hypothetical protein
MEVAQAVKQHGYTLDELTAERGRLSRLSWQVGGCGRDGTCGVHRLERDAAEPVAHQNLIKHGGNLPADLALARLVRVH